MNTITPATDSRLRRLARKKGYVLRKSRRYHPLNNLGGYAIFDPQSNLCVAGYHYDLDPSFVESWLSD